MAYYNIEDRYKHDATFNRVVDQMRALLGMYHITPSELREAVILAATMHESENIRPLYISRMNNAYPVSSYYNWANPPAMFGGIDPIGCATPKAPVVCDCTKELGKGAPNQNIATSSGT